MILYIYQPDYWWAGAILAGIGLLLAIPPFIRYSSTEYAVTNKRLLSKVGFVERESDETLLSKIEAVAVDQSIVGRMLGYGTLTITGTGGTDEGFPRISDPLEFRRQIQSQVVAQEERRGGTASHIGNQCDGQLQGRAGMSLLRGEDPGARSGVQALRTGRGAGLWIGETAWRARCSARPWATRWDLWSKPSRPMSPDRTSMSGSAADGRASAPPLTIPSANTATTPSLPASCS